MQYSNTKLSTELMFSPPSTPLSHRIQHAVATPSVQGLSTDSVSAESDGTVPQRSISTSKVAKGASKRMMDIFKTAIEREKRMQQSFDFCLR